MNPCSYCGEPVILWRDKFGDLFTHICKCCMEEKNHIESSENVVNVSAEKRTAQAKRMKDAWEEVRRLRAAHEDLVKAAQIGYWYAQHEMEKVAKNRAKGPEDFQAASERFNVCKEALAKAEVKL